MKIKTIEIIDSDEGQGYGCSRLTIELETNEGTETLSFGGGEPEDNSLARDLSDAYDIPHSLEMAYKAGLNNEPLEIILEEKCDDED